MKGYALLQVEIIGNTIVKKTITKLGTKQLEPVNNFLAHATGPQT